MSCLLLLALLTPGDITEIAHAQEDDRNHGPADRFVLSADGTHL